MCVWWSGENDIWNVSFRTYMMDQIPTQDFNSYQKKHIRFKKNKVKYPMEWAFAIFSWQIIMIFISVWVLVNILPWDVLGQTQAFSATSSFINELFNRYSRVPPPLQYSQLDEQFAVIGLFGIAYLIFVVFKTKYLPIVNENASPWTAPKLCLASGFLFLLAMFFLTTNLSPGIDSMTEESYQKWVTDYSSRTHWENTGRYVLYIYSMGCSLTFCIASLKSIINRK